MRKSVTAVVAILGLVFFLSSCIIETRPMYGRGYYGGGGYGRGGGYHGHHHGGHGYGHGTYHHYRGR